MTNADRGLLAGALLAVLSCVACTATPTQLVVHVDTDLHVGTEIDGFDVRVSDPGDQLVLERAFELIGPTSVELPATFGVAPRDGDPDRTVRIAVRASRPEGVVGDLEASARTGYVEHEKLRLDLFLARACIDFDCAEGTTCRAGRCVDEQIDPETLPREGEDVSAPDAAVPDAAVADAATTDAGPAGRETLTTVFPLRGDATFQNAEVALDSDGTAAFAAAVRGEIEIDGERIDLSASVGSVVVLVDRGGGILWHRALVSLDTAGFVSVQGVITDPSGRVVVVGIMDRAMSIDGVGEYEALGPRAAFRIVFEADGSLAGASPVIDSWPEGTFEPLDLGASPDGDILVIGQYSGTIRLDPDGADLVDPTGSGSFIAARYDTDGAFVDACTMTGGTGVGVRGLADGGFAAVGQFAGVSDHGLASHGGFDGLVARFGPDWRSAPDFAWAVGGTGLDQLAAVTVDSADRTVVVGRYS